MKPSPWDACGGGGTKGGGVCTGRVARRRHGRAQPGQFAAVPLGEHRGQDVLRGTPGGGGGEIRAATSRAIR